MKFKAAIIGGLIALAAVLGTASATEATGQPDTVHHPVEECKGTFIKDQPPFTGKTVTVAYTGNMWIKISTQHVFVPAVTKGEVYTPSNLSSWPKNKNGQPQAISHVDYCVPTTTTTTTTTTLPPETTTTTTQPPETTVPPTTAPPTTQPPETTEPPVTTQPPVVTTTEPPVVTTQPSHTETTVVVATDIPPVTPTVPPAGLPATGSTTNGIAGVALALMLAGALALAISRRKASNI